MVAIEAAIVTVVAVAISAVLATATLVPMVHTSLGVWLPHIPVVVVAAGVVVGGCTPSYPQEELPTPVVSTTTPTPSVSSSALTPPARPTVTSSPTPSATLSEEEAAVEAARPLVDAYEAVFNEMSQDPPSLATERFQEVATSLALVELEHNQQVYLTEGLHSVGFVLVTEVTLESVRIPENIDASTGKVPEVIFRVCLDISETDVVDANGNSAVEPDAPDAWVWRISVANYAYPDGPWLVAWTEQGETC
jgi:hypothetical protein